jgi:ubiquinone/menaquinone biosynthesis C-methylase UbiE
MQDINFFDEADYFNDGGGLMDQRARKSLALMASIKDREIKKVLDVGCGTGFFTTKMKDLIKPEELWGTDISKKALKHSKKLGIKVKKADLNKKFDFKDNYFDLVNCGEVIEHIYNPDNLLKEINRVMAPGGYLIITTPNLASWLNRVIFLFGIQPFFTEVSTENKTLGYSFLKRFVDKGKPIGHVRVMTLQAFKDILKYHGFEIVSVKGAYVPFRFIKHFDVFFSVFPSLSSVMLIKARKLETKK